MSHALASERHQVILSEAAAGWVREFSKEQRHSISKAIAILVEEAIHGRRIPALDASISSASTQLKEGGSSAVEASGPDFVQFLREKFAMDFEIWKRSKVG